MVLALFVLGTVTTLAYFAIGIRPSIIGGGEAAAVAANLAREGAYANPFSATARTGPTAHVPPLYPAYLAILMAFWGANAGMAATVLTAIVHGLHASLLPAISRHFLGRAQPGIYAAGICIALPAMLIIAGWDAAYSATGIMIFCLFARRQAGHIGNQFRGGALTGSFAAVLALMNPMLVSIAVVCSVMEMNSARTSRKHAALFSCGFLVCFLAICAPWIARNYSQFGSFFFLRDDLGIALYASNNDCSEPSLLANHRNGCHSLTHPIASPEEASLVGRLGEVPYNKLRLRTALAWVRDHPGRFVFLTRNRVVQFWFPPDSPAVEFITLLSVAGLIAAIRKRLAAPAFALSVFFTYPVIYYVVESNVRYRYPILWISALFAGYFVDRLWEFTKRFRPAQVRLLHAS